MIKYTTIHFHSISILFHPFLCAYDPGNEAKLSTKVLSWEHHMTGSLTSKSCGGGSDSRYAYHFFISSFFLFLSFLDEDIVTVKVC